MICYVLYAMMITGLGYTIYVHCLYLYSTKVIHTIRVLTAIHVQGSAYIEYTDRYMVFTGIGYRPG